MPSHLSVEQKIPVRILLGCKVLCAVKHGVTVVNIDFICIDL
jgi:hypothetical protein